MKVLVQESESVDALTSVASFQTLHRCFNDCESESDNALTSGASFQTPHRCCPRGLAPSHSSQRGSRRQNS